MKKSALKLVALGLCAALTAGSIGGAAYARTAGGERTAVPAVHKLAENTAATPYKDETVYVLAGADGAVQTVIVSDWLKNPEGAAALRDVTDLQDVENVKGGETYTQDGDALVWDAQGSDIYCQGAVQKDLPVDVAVTYTLDGQPVSPAELAGRSGRITIRFDYTNHQYQMVEIGGKSEKIYVPFAMVTGLVLDNERFTNVEISNGRLYSDGSRTVAVGLALPGLQENLDIAPEKLEIPDYVEVSAEVRDFALSNTLTIALSDPFRRLDAENLDAGELSQALGELTDAMDQLLDGSSQLYDGLCQLLDKSGALAGGVSQLADGARSLQAGADSLAAGASQLQAGTVQLQTGLDTLDAGSDALRGGAEQIFQNLLSAGSAQLATAGLELPALTAENYGQILDGVISAMDQGSEPVAALKASLDSYNAFYQGLLHYTAGVAEASGGARELSSGAADLKDGADSLAAGSDSLCEGALALQSGVPAMVDGITALRDGALELSRGLSKFNEQGIQKLVDAVDGDLNHLTERLQATANAAEGFQSFSGLAAGAEGQVKFVYRTEAIEAAA
ncbi:MAG: hypothetical protein K2P20_08015 [Oscillospiraceae bacterium]|nr:hypothetical protein [Oscillospiraceae bacterium]